MAVLVLKNGAIAPVGGGPVWAAWRGGNPLGARGVELPREGRVAMWSGWLEWEDEGDGAPGTADPRTWGAAGWAALERVMEANAGTELCVRTHHAHVLSDVPSCLRFAQRWADRGRKLIVDVGAMIAPSMVAAAEDHAARVLGVLGGHPAVAAVVLSAPGADGGPAPLHAGLLEPRVLVGLIGRYVPPDRPLVLLGDGGDGGGGEAGIERQVGLLAGMPHVS